MRSAGWSALAALALLAALGLVRVASAEPPGQGGRAPKRVVVLGIDGMDPDILREVMRRFPERMRSFAALAAISGVNELRTSTPPQSPVAWSSFITGRDPGGHGVFDFLHRDPRTRAPIPSTAVVEEEDSIGLPGSWQIPLGGGGRSNRSGESFWSLLARRGVAADVWRMPANFPVEGSRGWSFSGMMTPAIDSAYGECTLYTTSPPTSANSAEGRVVLVREFDGRIDARLPGPANVFREGRPAASVPLVVHVDREANAAALDVDGEILVLEPGEWSDFVEVRFALLPLGALDVAGVVRFYLRGLSPEFELYASPVNIDPLDPATPVSAPESASARVADRSRGGIGIYYTQGMPEDVNARKRDLLTDAEFLQQANLVHDEGLRLLDYALDRFLAQEQGGLCFFYVSGIDMCCHMLWRHHDESHPHHDAAFAARDCSALTGRAGSAWKDAVHDQYLRMDPLVGEVRRRLSDEAVLIVMSDHGFAPYARKFSLNTWLWKEGYLVLKSGADPSRGDVNLVAAADWSRTRAYGMGFNGLYLNLEGREQDDPATPENEGGIVRRGEEAEALVRELEARLEALADDARGGARIVLRADCAAEVYRGERLAEAPDLVVGYNAGYGNSDEASIGGVPAEVLQDNDRGGTFNGSHLMAPEAVPGLLLANRRVAPGPHALEDLTVEVLRQFAVAPAKGMLGHPVLQEP